MKERLSQWHRGRLNIIPKHKSSHLRRRWPSKNSFSARMNLLRKAKVSLNQRGSLNSILCKLRAILPYREDRLRACLPPEINLPLMSSFGVRKQRNTARRNNNSRLRPRREGRSERRCLHIPIKTTRIIWSLSRNWLGVNSSSVNKLKKKSKELWRERGERNNNPENTKCQGLVRLSLWRKARECQSLP